MPSVIKLTTPLSGAALSALRIGDRAEISGVIFTARDAACKRLVELIDRGGDLPVDIVGQIIYFAGPAPAPPGRPIGSCGPTTSGRMDSYSPKLLAAGLKGIIGKGGLADSVVTALVTYGGAYFASTGGAGALLARHVTASEVVAYPELGAEAIHKLTVENFPVTVAIDLTGANLYKEGFRPFRKSF